MSGIFFRTRCSLSVHRQSPIQLVATNQESNPWHFGLKSYIPLRTEPPKYAFKHAVLIFLSVHALGNLFRQISPNWLTKNNTHDQLKDTFPNSLGNCLRQKSANYLLSSWARNGNDKIMNEFIYMVGGCLNMTLHETKKQLRCKWSFCNKSSSHYISTVHNMKQLDRLYLWWGCRGGGFAPHEVAEPPLWTPKTRSRATAEPGKTFSRGPSGEKIFEFSF